MKKSLTAMLAASAVVLSFGLATAHAQESVPASAAENGNLWFVELSGNPTADGNSLKNVRAEKAAFKAAARAAGVSFKERRSFDVLFNGYSVEVAPGQLAKLHSVPGVKAIWPVVVVERPEVQTGGAPELFTAIQMTGADLAHDHGYTGVGVKVAVMDTGIDYDNPDLGGCFGPNCRVVYGWDLVGDAFNADSTSPTYNPVTTPDPDPDDCAGHGSHVAGIIGANGSVTGVAPDVTFGAYRVFGCEGSTFADVMLEAMERALADGMQVLNMSIGSSYQWPQYPTATASDRAVARGMIVVASIGNSGANGLYSAGAPGVGRDVIGTASFDNSHVLLPYFTVNGSNIGYQTMTFSAAPPTTGSAEIVYIGRACNVDTLAADPTGRTALAIRGTCSFAEKAIKAINAGAIAVVIYNSSPGYFSGTLGAPLGSDVPVVGISQGAGLYIRAQTPAPIMMTWTDIEDFLVNDTAGLISSFSSYGLAPDLSLKPDIGAPGGFIYSTYPLELGGHAVLGGTSMASPHVAGAAALLRQARPGMSAKAARDYLQNSADPKLWGLNPGAGLLDHVHRQGAGMVDVDDSINATTLVTPAKIAVGEGEAGPQTYTLTVRNTAASPVTYGLTSINALSSGGVIAPSYWGSDAFVDFSSDSVVVVPAGGSATFDATITPATDPVNGQYGGYIVLTPQGGGQIYRVPFAGFVGDYQGIQVLTPTANGFPWLSVLYEESFYKLTDPGQWSFSMIGDDIPFFLVHLDHQPRRMEFQVINAKNGKPVHPVFSDFDEFDYFGRSSTTTSFFAFAWDGTRMHDNGLGTPDHRKVVPNGQYKVVLKVLKALGNPANPAHWETWTSPEIRIARP